MATPNGFEYWQAGEQPSLTGASSLNSGGFEYWQAGEQPSYAGGAAGIEISSGQPTMARWRGIPGMTPWRTLHSSGRGW